MDFVLRDAFMTGFSQRSYDLQRLLHYSFFSEEGLTIHNRGMDALLRFMHARADLFRAVYFHRTVRAIDLTLGDLFRDSKALLFPGNPLEHLDAYLHFTEWSLLVDAARFADSNDAPRRELGPRWRDFLARKVQWQSIYDRNLVFRAADREAASLFSDADLLEHRLRKYLPSELADLPLRVDLPRHFYRPQLQAAASRQNFLYLPSKRQIRSLNEVQLFESLPISHRFCRVFVPKDAPKQVGEIVAERLDALLGGAAGDDLTNM